MQSVAIRFSMQPFVRPYFGNKGRKPDVSQKITPPQADLIGGKTEAEREEQQRQMMVKLNQIIRRKLEAPIGPKPRFENWVKSKNPIARGFGKAADWFEWLIYGFWQDIKLLLHLPAQQEVA